MRRHAAFFFKNPNKPPQLTERGYQPARNEPKWPKPLDTVGRGSGLRDVPVDRIERMTEARDLALPTGYADLLGELKDRVRAARTQAIRTVNTQLIELYWFIGKTILERQEVEQWGSGVLNRLAQDLRAEFPDMKGFSRSNLFYMRGFAAA